MFDADSVVITADTTWPPMSMPISVETSPRRTATTLPQLVACGEAGRGPLGREHFWQLKGESSPDRNQRFGLHVVIGGAAATTVPDQPEASQHPQVLRDHDVGDLQPARQLPDGNVHGFLGGQLTQKPEANRVAGCA